MFQNFTKNISAIRTLHPVITFMFVCHNFDTSISRVEEMDLQTRVMLHTEAKIRARIALLV
jgi:hypothetical protein